LSFWQSAMPEGDSYWGDKMKEISKMAKKKMVNIRLDSELWCKVKAQAAIEGKTLEHFIAEVLSKVVKG